MSLEVLLCILFVTPLDDTWGAVTDQKPRWVERQQPCSATCNGGIQYNIAECWLGDRRVSDLECAGVIRSGPEFVPCGQTPCRSERATQYGVPKWSYGDWGECSSKCGPGWRRRIPQCVIQLNSFQTREVEEKQCLSKPKPQDEMGQCSSGVSIPCPPFASPDVLCFAPPCSTSIRGSGTDAWGGSGGGDDGGSGDNYCTRSTPSVFAVMVLLSALVLFS